MNISRLSTVEYINIVGEYNFQIHGSSIDPAIYERGYTPAQLEMVKKTIIPKEIKSCNLLITSPLEEFSFKGFDYIFGLYSQYKKGILPFPGPLTEQPARIIEIFNLFEQLEHEYQRKVEKDRKTNER